MRTLLVASILVLVGCGKGSNMPAPSSPTNLGPCYSVSNGNWKPVDYNVAGNNNTLSLTDQCTGATTYCHEVFRYQVQADGVTVIVIIDQTNGGPQCLSLGAHTCTATMIAGQSNNQISIDCGPGKNITDNYNRM